MTAFDRAWWKPQIGSQAHAYFGKKKKKKETERKEEVEWEKSAWQRTGDVT